MKSLEELLHSSKLYATAQIQKHFKSHKNTVGYILFNGKPRVIKWFVPGLKNNMLKEYSTLEKGAPHLNIPTPFKKDERHNVILMSYIIGKNVCDLLNDDQVRLEEKKHVVTLIAEWYGTFHTFFHTKDQFMIRGDSNLRNFIFTDKVWGLDFEESRKGQPEEDIASLCSSLLSTDPMFTEEKFELCKEFITSYETSVSWKLNHISKEISYALLERIQWRPQDEETLRKYSEKIKKEGLTIPRSFTIFK